MPIYEYVCDECDETIEIIQKITDEPSSLCPNCHNHSLRKKTSISAFHLKGSGWYKDGYNGANINPDKVGDKTTESAETKSDDKKVSETSSEATAKPAEASTESTSIAAS